VLLNKEADRTLSQSPIDEILSMIGKKAGKFNVDCPKNYLSESSLIIT